MARTPVEERRTQLVHAALRVVASRGLQAASVRAIVAEAGMSLASFHYAFASRDALIDRLITEVLAVEETAIMPGNMSGTLTELLERGLRGYAAHLKRDPAREQAMLELTQYALRQRPELAREQYAQYTRMALATLSRVAEETGTRWHPRLSTVARLLVALTDGLTLHWLVTRDDTALDATITAAATAVASLAEAPDTPANAAPATAVERASVL